MIACTATIDLDSSTTTLSSRPQPIAFESLQQLKQLMTESPDFVQGDLADFRRAADNVRLAQLATILCATNLGDKWSPEGTALIGINGDGCALNNRLFWDDFISHGHDNGRASLFVPTLPSIPVCEAAIALHIQGPVRYIAAESASLLEEAISDMFATDSTLRQIMTVELFNRSVRCVLHTQHANHEPLTTNN